MDISLAIQQSGVLFPYQINWIGDDSKLAVWEKGKRTGGTFAEALSSILYSIRYNENVWFSSTDALNGKLFIQSCVEWAEIINIILGCDWIDTRHAQRESLTLPNGKRITSLSSNPKVLRGKEGRIILDEFAFHQDQEELFRAAQSAINRRPYHQLRVISTHNGPATEFANLLTKPEWSKHRTTLQDACDAGYALRFATDYHHLGSPELIAAAYIDYVRRTCLSLDHFNQEYMCSPMSARSLISIETYNRLVLQGPEFAVLRTLDSNRRYRPLFVGIDVGLTNDYTVVWVTEQLENKEATIPCEMYDYRTVCVLPIHNTNIPTQYEMMRPIIYHPDVQAIAIDIGTIGHTLFDMMDSANKIVLPISFHNNMKAELAERVNGFTQRDRISLPDDPEIRTDILSMQRIPTKNGCRYDGKTKTTHCDYFWAAALSLHAAASAPVPIYCHN